jgi:hypothetical protein
MIPLLDRLPAWARDLVVAVVPPLLGWVASDVIPALHPHTPLAVLACAVLAQAVYALTTIFTTAYGVRRRPLERAMRHVLRDHR